MSNLAELRTVTARTKSPSLRSSNSPRAGDREDPCPPLRPSDEEMAARRAAGERVLTRYGLTSWENAPAAAFREYRDYLLARMNGSQNGGEKAA